MTRKRPVCPAENGTALWGSTIAIADQYGNVAFYALPCPRCREFLFVKVHPAPRPCAPDISALVDQLTMVQDAMTTLKAMIEEAAL